VLLIPVDLLRHSFWYRVERSSLVAGDVFRTPHAPDQLLVAGGAGGWFNRAWTAADLEQLLAWQVEACPGWRPQ